MAPWSEPKSCGKVYPEERGPEAPSLIDRTCVLLGGHPGRCHGPWDAHRGSRWGWVTVSRPGLTAYVGGAWYYFPAIILALPLAGCSPRRPEPPCPSDSVAGRRTCRQMHPMDIQDDWIDRDCDPEEEKP